MNHKKRIAVIAVHGVGHQQPRTSAERTADLLRNQCKGYRWLGQSMLRIPVGAVSADIQRVENSDPIEKKDRAQYVSQTLKRAIQRKSNDPDERKAKYEIPLDVQDMQERLLGYKPRAADVTYETTCIELQKSHGPECHIFEMFWGDLSRQQRRKSLERWSNFTNFSFSSAISVGERSTTPALTMQEIISGGWFSIGSSGSRT